MIMGNGFVLIDVLNVKKFGRHSLATVESGISWLKRCFDFVRCTVENAAPLRMCRAVFLQSDEDVNSQWLPEDVSTYAL